ncbi:MAG: nicotinate (nicotinamide) nucleotide adenylyltransferase [bacterium]
MIFGSKKTRKRVVLFGGSFNPPHIGHTAICKWVFQRGLGDELWVIPCFIHPFGKELIDFDHRLEMSKLALSKLNLPIRILDVERALGGESKTLRTVRHLEEQNPENKFLLIAGSDVDRQFDEWHRFDELSAIVEVMHVPRGKGSPIPDVSSTEIRRRIAAGEQWRDMVEPEIAIYIVTKALYRK